ncbi:MAG: retroviral-like aspartic protease family protein [Anaerolineae bacterium]|nr:retroviral-like aspartic protease family protein [Anaerolineae bacterium]
MKFRYSRAFFPPAPVAEVTFITAAESLRVGPFSALLDSGADATIVPIAYLNEIQALPTVEMALRSQWGERRRVLLYLVDVQIGEVVLPGIEVVGDELSDEIVLGRDVLNRLRLLLDGPAEIANITE